VRVIVLDHTGPVFCSGADLRESSGGDAETASIEMVEILRLIMESDKPIIAKLAGPARAGGIGLVAACDFAVAVPEVTFAFSEVRIGVVPSIISVPLRVAPSTLHRLFLTGETFDASRAEQIGLLSSISSAADLDHDVMALVAVLRLGSPAALAGAKRLVRPTHDELAQQLEEMRGLSARFFASEEAKEGFRSFAERRPPAWAAETSPPRRSATGVPSASRSPR
jgi:methylglutaconyl-CoA hydratase